MDSSRTVNIAFRVPNKEERAATIEYLRTCPLKEDAPGRSRKAAEPGLNAGTWEHLPPVVQKRREGEDRSSRCREESGVQAERPGLYGKSQAASGRN
jgi:hypothetical protein